MKAGRGLSSSWHLLTVGSAFKTGCSVLSHPGPEKHQEQSLHNLSGQPVSDLTAVKANVTGFTYIEY